MIETQSEYIEATTELQKIEKNIVHFNEHTLLARGYPVWVVRSHKEYLHSRPKELKGLIQEYEKTRQGQPIQQPSFHKKRKRFRYRKKSK